MWTIGLCIVAVLVIDFTYWLKQMEQSKVQWSPPSRLHGSTTPYWRDTSVS